VSAGEEEGEPEVRVLNFVGRSPADVLIWDDEFVGGELGATLVGQRLGTLEA
jgi:hypothetical protein